MKLIVGLGNPGPEYEKTRHNAGFLLADRLAARLGFSAEKLKFHGGLREGTLAGERALILKPVTYMNRSGLAVGEAAAFYKVAPADVLVLVDDLALPCGQIRLRAEGSSGGHNGLTDVARALGTMKYPRLRLGIDPKGMARQSDYVLGRFTPDQAAKFDACLDAACQAVECWAKEGVEKAMTKFNAKGE